MSVIAQMEAVAAKRSEYIARIIAARTNNLIPVGSSKCGSYSSGEECSDKDDRCTEVDYRDSVTGYNSDDGYGTDNYSEVNCKGGDSVVSYSDYGVHEQCGKAKNKDSGSSALVAESQRRYQLLLGPEWKRYYEQCSGSGGYSSEEDVSSIHHDDDSVSDIYEHSGSSAKDSDSGSSVCVSEPWTQQQQNYQPYESDTGEHEGGDGYSNVKDVGSIHQDDDSVCDIYEQNGGSACVSEVWQKQHQLRRPWTQQQQNCQPYDGDTGEQRVVMASAA